MPLSQHWGGPPPSPFIFVHPKMGYLPSSESVKALVKGLNLSKGLCWVKKKLWGKILGAKKGRPIQNWLGGPCPRIFQLLEGGKIIPQIPNIGGKQAGLPADPFRGRYTDLGAQFIWIPNILIGCRSQGRKNLVFYI